MLRVYFMLWLAFSVAGFGCVRDEPPLNPFRQPILYPVGESPAHIVTADFNQDGTVDLAVANTGSNTVSLLFGKNDASFPETQTIKTGIGPRWLVSGDFNEDQKMDLGVLLNGEDSLHLLMNMGGGIFLKGAQVKMERSPYAATVEDFNGDQHLDIAIVSRFDHLLILLGDGTGKFKRGMLGDPGAIPTGIISGHFNGDSWPDLAIANNGSASSDIIFFWGKGDGTFQKGDRYRNGMNPIAVISADFNQDGRPDILSLNSLGDSITPFLSNKEGGYTQERDFAAEGGSMSAIVHDFNGDKQLDLIVSNARSDNVSFILGNKNGKFQFPHLNFFTGKGPFHVVKSDFNLDGRMDIAVANNNEKSVAILIGK